MIMLIGFLGFGINEVFAQDSEEKDMSCNPDLPQSYIENNNITCWYPSPSDSIFEKPICIKGQYGIKCWESSLDNTITYPNTQPDTISTSCTYECPEDHKPVLYCTTDKQEYQLDETVIISCFGELRVNKFVSFYNSQGWSTEKFVIKDQRAIKTGDSHANINTIDLINGKNTRGVKIVSLETNFFPPFYTHDLKTLGIQTIWIEIDSYHNYIKRTIVLNETCVGNQHLENYLCVDPVCTNNEILNEGICIDKTCGDKERFDFKNFICSDDFTCTMNDNEYTRQDKIRLTCEYPANKVLTYNVVDYNLKSLYSGVIKSNTTNYETEFYPHLSYFGAYRLKITDGIHTTYYNFDHIDQNRCGVGTEFVNGRCEIIQEQDREKPVCIGHQNSVEDENGEVICLDPVCKGDQTLTDGICVNPVCIGFQSIDLSIGECVGDPCRPTEVFEDGVCVELVCEKGMIAHRSECIDLFCATTHDLIDGVCVKRVPEKSKNTQEPNKESKDKLEQTEKYDQESKTEPMYEESIKQNVEPVIEPTVEPIVEPEPTVEPVVEPTVEPVVEPEQVVEPEPIQEKITCGTGTELVNGICQVIQIDKQNKKISKNNPNNQEGFSFLNWLFSWFS